MTIEKFNSSQFMANTYLVWDEKSNDALIIDPAGSSKEVDEEIAKNKLKLKKIVNTHGHFDHTGLNKYFQTKYNAKSLLSHKDLINFQENK